MRFQMSLWVAAFCAAMVTTTSAQTVQLNKNGRNVQVVSNAKLGPKSTQFMKEWRNGRSFFGALVFNSAEDGQWGSIYGFHSLETARKGAMALCRADAKQPNACFEYAYVLPRGYDPNASGQTLGKEAQDAFRGKYTKSQKKSTFAAFAISDAFDWGWANNRPSAAAAQEQAILSCEASIARSKAGASPTTRKALKLDRLKCRVIHTAQR